MTNVSTTFYISASVGLLTLLIITLAQPSVEYTIPAIVTVNPIYQLSIAIDILNETIFPGDYMNVSVELNKTDLIELGAGEEINVYLYYEIFKPKGKERTVIESDFAGIIKVVNHTEEIIQIPIPLDIKTGKYVLSINATHPQAYSAQDEDDFLVKRKPLGLREKLFLFFRFWQT